MMVRAYVFTCIVRNNTNTLSGTHLSAEAYRIFEQELSNIIVDTWPELQPERIDYALPAWNDKEAWGKLPV